MRFAILQPGELPLRPRGGFEKTLEHRCTVTMIWPDNEAPGLHNTLLVDPNFTKVGYDLTLQALKDKGLSLMDVRYVFVTHPHGDHIVSVPFSARTWQPVLVHPAEIAPLSSLNEQPCPGHNPHLTALNFTDPAGKHIWVVGDAILDEEWLRGWKYYWPNGYMPAEIVQTWHSVALILAKADVIIPGHGSPIQVTASLLRDLVVAFPQADFSEQCPTVTVKLRARLDQLIEGNNS
jgi:glyoxylase-like metal-dependent hydrolase (beta-lactamase superfamily II)